MLVALTARGCICAEAAFREDMVVENAFVAKLSAHERDELARLLQKLALLIEETS